MSRRNKFVDVFRYIDMSGGPDACWPWLQKPGGVSRQMRDGKVSASSKPRPYFTVEGRKYTATRVVYELTYGVELQPDEVIRHKCDTSMCTNPKHMEVGSHKDNMQDMVARDRHGLPHHVVRRIRVLLQRGSMTHAEIGTMYAVSRTVVTRIANDQAHTHTDDYPTQEDIDADPTHDARHRTGIAGLVAADDESGDRSTQET